MLEAMTIIFGFMVFMVILTKGHLLFINITSLLIIAAISFGVGYGISLFLMEISGSILKVIIIFVLGTFCYFLFPILKEGESSMFEWFSYRLIFTIVICFIILGLAISLWELIPGFLKVITIIGIISMFIKH